MSPVHNGPARNKPKGHRPATSADPAVCRCAGGRPTPIATFREQALVDVELRHLISAGCGRPSEHVEPRDYQAGIGRR